MGTLRLAILKFGTTVPSANGYNIVAYGQISFQLY